MSLAYREANVVAIRSSAAFVPLVRMAILAGFTCTLLLGGWQTLDGDLELGLYSVLVFMTQRLLWPLTAVAEVLDLYQRGRASTARILALLAGKPVDVPAGTSVLARPVGGRVELRGVRAGYADGPDVLHDLDLVVPAGETHAIVGPTGAGKSSLLRLGAPLRRPALGPGAARRHRRARPRLGLAARLDGVRRPGRLPLLGNGRGEHRLRTPRRDARGGPGGSRGCRGRRVRRAAARGLRQLGGGAGDHPVRRPAAADRAGPGALLRDPAILVLDEATSAVDNETEAAIQQSLRRAGERCTTIVVAHRLSTVRHAHRIWVLDGGRVAEAGTHDELVALGGAYAALWKVQTGEQ